MIHAGMRPLAQHGRRENPAPELEELAEYEHPMLTQSRNNEIYQTCKRTIFNKQINKTTTYTRPDPMTTSTMILAK